jgi:uncharacterized protein YjbJ (UPF0337 family)
MKSKISGKAEGTCREAKGKDKDYSGKQIDTSKLEGEGACEKIVGKDEKEVCKVKT